MAEPSTQAEGRTAVELPTKYLPAVTYRDLPEPRRLRNYMGASIILSATALGSGELILWPNIATQVGMGLAWLSVLGISMQFFLNMEIERYTLVTGETAVTGFSRMWLPWGVIFVLGAILPNLFPGWATSGATVFTFIFGMPESAMPMVATIFLVAIGLAVTVSPVIYRTIERAEAVMVAVIVLFIIVAIIIASTADAWTGVITQIPNGIGNMPSYFDELGVASLLGAVVFAGAGGANNLVQSNYLRDKGLGMGIHIPNIVSPITGEEVAAPSLGYYPPDNADNRRRWNRWWRIANQEQAITFWFIGASLLVGMAVLAYSTVGIDKSAEGLDFIKLEGQDLAGQIGPWFETFFYVAAFLMLFSTNIGVVDYVSRLAGDSLKITFLKDSQFWSESKIYVTTIWLLIVMGSLIVWTGIEPVVLLIISAVGGGFVMAVYSVLLLLLNRKHLPGYAKLRGYRVPVMVFISLFYIVFALYLIYQMVTQGPGSVV
ncbi:MAG: hypothetical protein GEV11_21220 [Streptosporangiales bacterium]|nr:hypothetical protein [Streptosporangiales bacterium]